MLSAKPYWDNPTQEQFTVKIASCSKLNGEYHIVIDKDVIRAEGGGQAGERGSIVSGADNVDILNVVTINSNTCLIANAPIEVGKEVVLNIDMNWRTRMMRNHTAEHLFVSQMKRINPSIELGYIWIDGDSGTVEILGTAEMDQVFEAEKEVQHKINESHAVTTRLVGPEEVTPEVRAREGVQQKHDRIRIVKIEGVDESACSGIHAANTSDIEIFKIQDIRIHETSTRIHFVTSKKAMELLASVYNDALRRKQMYPFEMEQLGMVLDKAKRTSDSKEELIPLVVSFLADDDKFELINGIKFKHYYLPGFDTKDLRMCLKALPPLEKSAVLLFSPGQKSNIVFWINGLSQTVSDYISKAAKELGGRGGGSKDSYTGGFSVVQEPEALYTELVQRVRKNLV